MAKEGKPIQMGRGGRGMGPMPKLDHPLQTFARLISIRTEDTRYLRS